MPALQDRQQQVGPKYGRSWAWDWQRGDFVLDGAGGVVRTDGYTAWAHWCVKAIGTQRYAHLIYGPSYGAEIDEARRGGTRAAVEAELTRAITEALLADPRTHAAREFTYHWLGDTVSVSFTVEPVIGTPERLEVRLSA